MQQSKTLDSRNTAMREERLAARGGLDGPLVGDWIVMLDGTHRRFTHQWPDGLQVTCGDGGGGSFYLHETGGASFSGALDPCVPNERIKPTQETRDGVFWFFDHDISGAGRGVDFSLPCRVFREV